MQTQESALIDRMAESPSFISMCQFGDICLRVIKSLFKERKDFLIINNYWKQCKRWKINLTFHVTPFIAILINEDISKDEVNFRNPIIIANDPFVKLK